MVFSLFKKKVAPAIGSAASNDMIRAQLARMGDDGGEVRHVVHYAYPNKDADLSSRDAIIADLKAKGFEVKDAVAENGLVMEQYRTVTASEFDGLTAELVDWFAARGWGYDGWECAVVQKQ